MILGIDTSLGTSVGIVDAAGQTLADVSSDDPRGHAEVIGTLIERALAEAGLAPHDIAAVAAGMGPGPFTGLRVGIAAARAFALGGARGRGIPFVPVASHDAAALAIVDGGARGRFAVVTDARRREEAVTVYDTVSGAAVRVGETRLQPRGAAVETERIDVVSISGGALARVAAARIAAGDPDPDGFAAAAEPLYLRAPDVTVPAALRTAPPTAGVSA